MSSNPANAIEMTASENRAAQADLDHVRAVVADSGTSFFWAMRLLPAPRRDAMFAIYAFCREVDDIADEPAPMAEKSAGLAAWREEVARLYAGAPTRPTGRALLGPVGAYGLRQEDFLALIEGMEMDAADIRAPTMAELELYCDRVACAVGRLSVRAFGATDARAEGVAFSLGQALQLTNILRDIEEDAERGRLYLPRELLAASGIEATDPVEVLRHPSLPAVCDALATVAEGRFAEARAALAHCAGRPMRPARMMMEIYRRTLARLRVRGWSRLGEPVTLPKTEKLWIALRHGLL